jgi:hypothetical protein
MNSTIFALTDWQFWLSWLGFLLASWLVWFLPGKLLLRQLGSIADTVVGHAISYVIGLVLWTVTAYGLGWLQLRWLLPFSTIYLALTELKQSYPDWRKVFPFGSWFDHKNLSSYFYLPFLLIIGLFIQLPAVFSSGLLNDRGAEFYFSNTVDGIMHLAFIQNLVSYFPPTRPEAVGLHLTNYHYLGDLAIAELVRVFHLPITHIFFHYLPGLFSVLGGILVYQLIKAWGGRRSTGIFGLFFWYLGSDAAYLISWWLHKTWGWQVAAIDNGPEQFLNPPQVFAKLIFLAGLWLLTQYWQKKQTMAWWLTVLLFGSLITFKVYFGLFALFATGCAVLWRTYLRKAHPQEWFGLFAMAVLSLGLFWPNNHGSEGGLVFVPLIWPKLILNADHLNWQDWWLRQQVYESHANWRNVWILNSAAVIVALISFYGTRLIGWIGLVKHLPPPEKSTWAWFWWPASLLFLFLGFNTMQNPGGFNTFNFIVVTMVPMTLLSAFTLDEFWQHRLKYFKIIVVCLVLLTIPRSIYLICKQITTASQHETSLVYTRDEMELLHWIAKNIPPEAIIQVNPNQKTAQETSYVSFFTQRQTYLTGENILTFQGLQLPERHRLIKRIFESNNTQALRFKLQSVGISYLYILNTPTQRVWVSQLDLLDNVVYQNPAGWVIKL